jgi:hypothetical protein
MTVRKKLSFATREWRAHLDSGHAATDSVAKMMLRKERVSRISPDQLVAFYQLIRIIGSLRGLMKLHIKVGKNQDRIESTKDHIELDLLTAATYYESVKCFVLRLLPQISRSHIMPSDLKAIERLKGQVNRMRRGTFISLSAVIRNEVIFHFDFAPVKSNIAEGPQKTDVMIGYARSPAIIDCVYLEPYSGIFQYLSKKATSRYAKKAPIQWITSKTTKETDRFCRILERIANSFFKKNGYLIPTSIAEMLQ